MKILHHPKSIDYKYKYSKKHFVHSYDNDYQLFILWENSRKQEKAILDDLKKSFDVLAIKEVSWSQKYMGDNFHRLYNFPANGSSSTKSALTGEGPFIVVILEDLDPVYEYRRDASGNIKLVNSNVVDKKRLYRDWTGGGYLIHSTDNRNEFFANISLLFPYEWIIKILSRDIKCSKKIQNSLNQDLVGKQGWESIEELFGVLNLSTEYVVLRNPKGMANTVENLSGDIDILCRDLKVFTAITNASRVANYKNFYHIYISDKKVLFDVREADEEYYDVKWQEDVLKNRILSDEGIYTPRLDDYFFTHLYHVYVHKKFDSSKYVERLCTLSKSIGFNHIDRNFLMSEDRVSKFLRGYMEAHGYTFVFPADTKVFINIDFVSKLTKQNKVILFYRKFNYLLSTLPLTAIQSSKESLKQQKLVYWAICKFKGLLKRATQ